MKPRLIDLFCGAGGATRGYQLAGFYVLGVDINPQPHYCGDEFVLGDAMEILANVHSALGYFKADAIHASPPCQRYSDLAKRNDNANDWPDLIAPVRRGLQAWGGTFVIENVEGSPLLDPLILCGTMFPGLRVLRHRLFESNRPIPSPPHPSHPLVFTHDKRKAHYGKLDQNTAFVQVTGGGNCSVKNARSAMGIDWMSKGELNEAIPPAYTHWIGQNLKGVM